MNVLLSCAGRRHYLASFFQDCLRPGDNLIGVDMNKSAASLAACDYAEILPPFVSSEYPSRLAEVFRKYKIDMFFSLNDYELHFLYPFISSFDSFSPSAFYIPSSETYLTFLDKFRTFKLCQSLRIPSPFTCVAIDDALLRIDDGTLRFPLVVKPRFGSGSHMISYVNTPQELESAFSSLSLLSLPFDISIPNAISRVIIQEFLPGSEFGVDVLYDKFSNFIGASAKRKLKMRSGETDQAISVEVKPFLSSILSLSKSIVHRGNLDIDFIVHDNVPYLLEANPRFGGGYPFAHAAGANHVQYLIADYNSSCLPSYCYESGLSFSKCDRLVSVDSLGL